MRFLRKLPLIPLYFVFGPPPQVYPLNKELRRTRARAEGEYRQIATDGAASGAALAFETLSNEGDQFFLVKGLSKKLQSAKADSEVEVWGTTIVTKKGEPVLRCERFVPRLAEGRGHAELQFMLEEKPVKLLMPARLCRMPVTLTEGRARRNGSSATYVVKKEALNDVKRCCHIDS